MVQFSRGLILKYKGKPEHKPKNISADEIYYVVGIEHEKEEKILIENGKERKKRTDTIYFFVIDDNAKLIAIPSFNCAVFLDESNVLPEDEKK